MPKIKPKIQSQILHKKLHDHLQRVHILYDILVCVTARDQPNRVELIITSAAASGAWPSYYFGAPQEVYQKHTKCVVWCGAHGAEMLISGIYDSTQPTSSTTPVNSRGVRARAVNARAYACFSSFFRILFHVLAVCDWASIAWPSTRTRQHRAHKYALTL